LEPRLNVRILHYRLTIVPVRNIGVTLALWNNGLITLLKLKRAAHPLPHPLVKRDGPPLPTDLAGPDKRLWVIDEAENVQCNFWW
jgi:hypothetical protein